MRQRLWISVGVLVAVVCAYVLLSKRRSSETAGELASVAGSSPSATEQKGQLPQALPFPELVERKLSEAWAARASHYKPRTKHLRADGKPQYTNRLFLESSPYLLQHAHNPVNWFPWGEEAFDLAHALGRPILLSVGYSTCHWCHVMEEESFEDVEIAETLNRHYIAIKVDREERPDIDSIYMSAVRMLTRSGGWPMTVWLTADKTPFHGGSYFPARDGDRGSRVGFLTLLKELSEQYQQNPGETVQSATELALKLQRSLESSRPGGLPGTETLQRAMSFYANGFDDTDGGMRRAPKFPSNLPVRFLLRYHRRTGDAAALKMASLTLEKMAAGGIYDHVGGGFHRYSTDAQWLVPHFEKMLYDNALLTLAYLEGYQATGNEVFAKVAREILRYVSREMTAPQGGFYSATDADSLTPSGKREEGWFFTWTPAELEDALGKDLARVAKAYFAVREQGNFEGRSILHTPLADAAVAKILNIDGAVLRSSVATIKSKLYEKRQQRPAPLRDEKVLTAWNGLMISAFARASMVLDDAESLAQAKKAAQFLLTQRHDGGRLFRTISNGSARHDAYLDDYAFLIAALLDLYEASHEARWIEQALELDKLLEAHYADPKGGYFMTSNGHEALLVREKPSYDGAEPSGNSVQLLNLLRFHEFTTEERFRERAEAALRAFGGQLSNSASALSEMLLAVDFYLDAPAEILIVTPKTLAEAEPLLAELHRHFLPNKVVSVVSEGSMLQEHARWVPLLGQKVARGGVATAYVCERGACELPTSSPSLFATQLKKLGGRFP